MADILNRRIYRRSTFAKNLERNLKKSEWSQHRLATELGTSDAAVSRWLSSERVPRGDTVAKIAIAMDISVDDLLLEDIPAENEGLSH